MLTPDRWTKDIEDKVAAAFYDEVAKGRGIMSKQGWRLMYAAVIPMGGIGCDSDTDTPILADQIRDTFKTYGLVPHLEAAAVPEWNAISFALKGVEVIAETVPA